MVEIFASQWNIYTFASLLVLHRSSALWRLKGNTVKFRNCPAAVSSVNEKFIQATVYQNGKAFVSGVSQKTCHKYLFHSFRGLKLEMGS